MEDIGLHIKETEPNQEECREFHTQTHTHRKQRKATGKENFLKVAREDKLIIYKIILIRLTADLLKPMEVKDSEIIDSKC